MQTRGISRVELSRRSGGDIGDSMRGRCSLNSFRVHHLLALILPDEMTGCDGAVNTVTHVISRLSARLDRPLQAAGVHPTPAQSGRGHSCLMNGTSGLMAWSRGHAQPDRPSTYRQGTRAAAHSPYLNENTYRTSTACSVPVLPISARWRVRFQVSLTMLVAPATPCS